MLAKHTSMVYIGGMTLSDYLELKRINNTQFARIIGRSGEAVRRYREGARIPAPDVMVDVFLATEGAVQPNDFYNLPVLK